MKFIILARQRSLFNKHLLPILEIEWYSEGLEYVSVCFDIEYPELEILEIN